MKLRYISGLTYDIVQLVADTLASRHIKYIELHQNIFVLKHDKDIGLVYDQVIPHRINPQDTFHPVTPTDNTTGD